MHLLRPKQGEMIRQNEEKFAEGWRTQEGPLKYMEMEQREAVHNEIDIRLKELEESGLTREEILFNQVKGIPLIEDPFFQLVKNNKLVREMLVSPTEAFTADKVVERALRQDIGPDPTSALRRRDWKPASDEGLDPVWEYKKKYRDEDPVVRPEDYYFKDDLVKKRLRDFRFDQEKPETFINRPLTRGQIRKKFMRRQIRRSDIDWKDQELVVRFLNQSGKILNRFQTRLPNSVQRKLARTVKHMKSIGLLPTTGLLKLTDKINLGTHINDVEELNKKVIDPLTGRLFVKD